MISNRRAQLITSLLPLSSPICSISLFAGLGEKDIIVGSIGYLYYASYGDTSFTADTSLAKLTDEATPIFCFASRNDTLFTAVGGNFYKLFWGYIYRRGFFGDIFDSVVAYDAHRLDIPYLGDRTVYSLALNNAYIFAGTEDGLWRLSYPVAITRVEHFQDIPSGFVLEQNYPNPFNPTTNISYRLATNTLVALKVYDILGREIKTLVNERQAAGAHSVTFNAGTLASGVYFYRMQAGIFTQTKELVFSK